MTLRDALYQLAVYNDRNPVRRRAIDILLGWAGRNQALEEKWLSELLTMLKDETFPPVAEQCDAVRLALEYLQSRK